MTSSNRDILCITGPLWGESTSHRRIPLTKASDAELDFFVWCGWANSREAGDLRHDGAHYDVTVILGCYKRWSSMVRPN